MGARSGRWVIGGLVVVLVGLLVAIGLTITSRGTVDEALSARQQEVAEAASAEAVAFLTVDHEDMDPLIEAVLAGATGDFAEQYADQRAQLKKQARRSEATSVGEIVSLGVGDLDESSARVLIAANTRVTNKLTDGETQTRYYRMQLDLVLEDGRWLTSNLEFVRDPR